MHIVWLSLTWLSITLLVIGVGLLFVGLRGRRLDDHRLCRRCRFDLTGLSAEHSRCPECGSDLHNRRAVRTGNRRRRPWAIAIGTPITLIGVILAGLDLWSRANQFDFNTIKPTPLLVWELEQTNPAAAAGIARELIVRIRDDERRPRADQLIRLRDRALAVQADANATWLNEWGDLIYALSETEIFRSEHWREFLQSGMEFSFQVRSEIPQGERVQLQTHIAGPRLGVDRKLSLWVQHDSVRVGEHALEFDQDTTLALVIGIDRRTSITLDPTTVVNAGVGSHELEYTCTVELFPIGTRLSFSRPECESLTSWPITFTAPVTILPTDAEVLRLVENDDLQREVMDAVQLSDIRARVLQSSYGMVQISGFIGVERPVIDLVMDVYIKVDGQEHQGGRVVLRASQAGIRTALHAAVYDFDHDRATFILRPSREAALEQPGITEIFGGELIFEDVEIEWPQPPPGQ